MFDKMKQLMEMQKKMQEVKRELDNTYFDIDSSDGLVKLTMNASQELKNISIQGDIKTMDKAVLEKAIRDVYNKAIKRSQEIGAEKMKKVVGSNIPGF